MTSGASAPHEKWVLNSHGVQRPHRKDLGMATWGGTGLSHTSHGAVFGPSKEAKKISPASRRILAELAVTRTRSRRFL